jgi:hypothetical protein
MISIQMSRSWRQMALAALCAGLTSAVGLAEDQARPTPRPGTLGAYAREITLDRTVLEQSAGRLILTNDTVIHICEGARITLGAVTVGGHDVPKAPNDANPEKRRWQAAYRRQQGVIADLSERMSLLEIEIDLIEKQQLTPKVLARLDRAEAKRRYLEQKIRHARGELARIVRDARRHGAEPEWFR